MAEHVQLFVHTLVVAVEMPVLILKSCRDETAHDVHQAADAGRDAGEGEDALQQEQVRVHAHRLILISFPPILICSLVSQLLLDDERRPANL